MSTATVTAAQRSIAEVERMAAYMARRPGREYEWAVERIRIIADDGYAYDAEARRQVRNVLAALDLAEQRRQAAR